MEVEDEMEEVGGVTEDWVERHASQQHTVPTLDDVLHTSTAVQTDLQTQCRTPCTALHPTVP